MHIHRVIRCLGRRSVAAGMGAAALSAVVLGAVAVGAPVRAQGLERPRRLGVLFTFDEGDPVGQARLKAFRDGLRRSGGSRAATSRSTFAGPGTTAT